MAERVCRPWTTSELADLARIDYEARMAERIEEDYKLIDLACRVLYGEESGKGGVDALMGSAVADCISFRYVDARPYIV